MLDAWIIDRVQRDREEREIESIRTPLYAPNPLPPERNDRIDEGKPERGVVEDVDQEFLI